MFRIWKTRRARKVAVSTILPFVTRSRAAREIPDSLWFDPYFVGYIGMLITLTASWKGSGLGTDDLASVQSQSWATITGLRGELIGDEICSLSAAHDERFELGCRNALAFFQALQSDTAPDLYPGMADDPEREKKAALWARHFDSYVSEYMTVYMR